MAFTSATAIFRMFDVDKSRAFYVDYLGFSTVFEHRFSENGPLYLGLQRDGIHLHLSEHHSDATPISALRIEVSEIEAYLAELTAKNYPYVNPGLQQQSWGCREIIVRDPSGNRVVFYEDSAVDP